MENSDIIKLLHETICVPLDVQGQTHPNANLYNADQAQV